LEFLAHITNFFKAIFLNPRATGAVLPSSIYLSRKMASYIDPTKPGFILELGPGTGAITKAILDRGIKPCHLIALEIAPHFSKQLRQEFPGITLIEGNAMQLSELIQHKPIHTIISSLPLRSLSDHDREIIFSEIPKVLSSGGQFIQFTYSMKKDMDYYPSNFKLTHSSIVLRNIPPARVTVFEVK
jgi:phosphatidylethanolamine/phosphatidyl-N-methylethanolamine N-methyltransferase